MPIEAVRTFYATFRHRIHEVGKFGAVGAINYVVDAGFYNLFLDTVFPNKPITAKTLSTTIAATSSYFMNRHWTWKERARTGVGREFTIFILLSAVALGITLAFVALGEYGLHQNGWIGRNVWGNVIGVGAAMFFRFWAFKKWVFLKPPEPSAPPPTPVEATIRTLD